MSQLKKWMSVALLVMTALVICILAVEIPVSAAAEDMEVVDSYPYTTVTRDTVNLRASRSTRSALLKKIPAGATISVRGTKGDWAEVDYGKYTGYVKSEFIVLKKVSKTKAKVTPTPTPVPTLTPEENAGGYVILRLGSIGTEVRALQDALIELGFLKGTADGTFGTVTENAVIAFQRMNNYPDTGLMDANIQAFLYSGSPKNASGVATKIKTLSPAAGVTMKQGNMGQAVEMLQIRLKELGYYNGIIISTFDAATKSAVQAFQKKNGIKTTGIADDATQKAIYSASALSADSTPTPKPTATPKLTAAPTATPAYTVPKGTVGAGTSNNNAKTVQMRLKDLGYYTGKTDGIFGKKSVEALKKFQSLNGLKADGVAGQKTYDVLFSSNALTLAEAEATPTPTPVPTATPTPAPEVYTPVPVTGAPIVWKTLRQGSTGQEVAQLQEALIQLGYLTGKADGNYGKQTVAAVKAFQRANGLTADGAAGEKTQKKLYGAGAVATVTPAPTATPKSGTAASTTLRKGDSGEAVKELQRKLIALGYLSGNADGIYGSKTRDAVAAFQKKNKLTADGIAGSLTQAKLAGTAVSSATATPAAATATPAPSGQSGQTGTIAGKPDPSKVIYANWYTTVKAVCRSYPYATVYDYQTGISWQVHIFSLGAHADNEPLTANDTAKMLRAFGKNTWNPRPVWVIFADGSVYMASTHSMPHGTQHNKENNFDGHCCIHFPRTQEQVTNIGPYATSHQEMIDKGWAATQAMK